MPTKLTDSQLVILSGASSRDTCHVLPLPASLTLNKGSAALVLKSLIARGLVAEILAVPGNEIWRQREDGVRLTLCLTQAALKALGLENDGADVMADHDCRRFSTDDASGVCKVSSAPANPVWPAPGTKHAIILDLLRQPDGAALTEIVSATGWQAHSVRGAISGTIRKRLGLQVETLMIEGRGKIYRVTTAGTPSHPGEAA